MKPHESVSDTGKSNETKQDSISGYAPVNGLKMYYEIHGKGKPIVLIHGGGSTIQTTFGTVLHAFAKNRQVIAVELQGHGHTADIDRDLSFEQDADDVAALIKYLKIDKADFFGFSNGGNTAIQISIRHPDIVRKLVVGSAFINRNGAFPGFFDFMKNVTLKDMPKELQSAFLKVAPPPANLQALHDRCQKRMVNFKDVDTSDIKKISAPVFIISGDKDVALLEHTVEMLRLFQNSKLAIIPGGHGAYIGEVSTISKPSKIPELTVAMIEEFLDEPLSK